VVLDAYLENPNAAAVARALGRSERNVRRIRDRFAYQLHERWSQRDAELEARADARWRRVQDWIDAGLDPAMAQFDDSLQSENESVRLRAAKVRIDLAIRPIERGIGGTSLTDLVGATSDRTTELQQQLNAMPPPDPTKGTAA
jgi:hypothetical protein